VTVLLRLPHLLRAQIIFIHELKDSLLLPLCLLVSRGHKRLGCEAFLRANSALVPDRSFIISPCEGTIEMFATFVIPGLLLPRLLVQVLDSLIVNLIFRDHEWSSYHL